MDEEDSIVWTVIAGAVALGAAQLAKKALNKGWSTRRGFVPGTPGDGKTSWKEAAVFAVVSGVAVGLARLVADRGVQAVKARRSGALA